MIGLMSDKDGIREEMKAGRLALSESERMAKSEAICQRLQGLFSEDADYKGLVLAGYMACKGEADLSEFMQYWLDMGGCLVVPVFNEKLGQYEMRELLDLDAGSGKWGVPEPKKAGDLREADDISFWLVPGLAFDSNGGRLGYGKGVYDRLLSGSTGIKIGIAYAFQVVEALPLDAHDVGMDLLLSDSFLAYDSDV